MTKIRAVACARSATVNDAAIEIQLEQIRRYCKSNDLNLTDEFVENGVSGGSGSRKRRQVLGELLEKIRAKMYDVLVVLNSARLSRDIGELPSIYGEIKTAGCEVVFVDAPTFDGSTALALKALEP